MFYENSRKRNSHVFNLAALLLCGPGVTSLFKHKEL